MKTNTNFFAAKWLRLLPGLGLVLISAGAARADIITWTGAVDAIYTKPGNWNLGRVPNWMDDVRIPATATQPILDATLGIGAAGSLTINSNATLTLSPQSELDLYGDLTLMSNATFVGMGLLSVRQPITGPAIPHTIGGPGNPIVISDLELMANAPVALNIPMSLRRELTLTSNLTTSAAGPLTLLSTVTATAFVVNQGGIVIGNVIVQRAIDASVNAGLGYRHYSSPVSNSTVGDLATSSGFTPEISQAEQYNASPTPPLIRPFPTVYGYDQALVNRNNSSPNFDKGFFVPSTLSTLLVPGRGYTVNLNGAQLVDFVGSLTNGPISVSVARNATGTLNSDVAGYSLLGNPYPSPIDWSRATALRTAADLADGMYVYSSTSQYGGFYRAYANGVGNPVIPLGQAFFVRKITPNTTSTFTFTNDLRLTSSDGTTFQRQAPDQRPQVELALSGSDKVVQDMLNVYFQSGSTDGFDGQYDALKPLNNNGVMLNTLTPDGQALAIDGRPLPTDQLTLPLQLKVAVSGTYTLNTSKLTNMGDLHVYLRDSKQGTLTDLSKQPTYTTTLNANAKASFELIFSSRPVEDAAPAALTRQVSLYPSPAKDVAFIGLPAKLGGEAIEATLVDAIGRTVRTASLPAQGEATHQLSLSGLKAGIYALRLHTSEGIVAKRLVIE